MITDGFGIKTWAEEDRPREKMLLKGKAALSDAELIAILIGSGTRELSAVELSRKILALADNNLVKLGQIPLNQLMELKGIGEAKAISLAAALELGRRRQQSDAEKRIVLDSSQKGYQLLAPCIADLPHEEFWVVLLNRKHEVIRYKSVSSGGISGTVADPRLIFSWAVTENASAIILAHNHPSGNLQPSEADRRLTQQLKKAGEVLEIIVSDHLIITDRGYFSFADQGLL